LGGGGESLILWHSLIRWT